MLKIHPMKEVSCRILGKCVQVHFYTAFIMILLMIYWLLWIVIVMWVSILLKVYVALTVFYTSAVKSSTMYDQEGWDVPRRIWISVKSRHTNFLFAFSVSHS